MECDCSELMVMGKEGKRLAFSDLLTFLDLGFNCQEENRNVFKGREVGSLGKVLPLCKYFAELSEIEDGPEEK